MARGFLSGALWGVVVAGVGAGTASVVTGPVMAPQPNAQVETGPSGSAPLAPAADALPSTTPEAPRGQAKSTSPGVPDQDGLVAGPELDVSSAPRPETGQSATLPQAPSAGETGAVALSADAPVLPNPQALQPVAPKAEELSISTNPAQPPAPAEEVVQAPVLEAGSGSEAGAEVAVETDVTVAPDAPEEAQSPQEESAAEGAVSVAESAPDSEEAPTADAVDRGDAEASDEETAMAEDMPKPATDTDTAALEAQPEADVIAQVTVDAQSDAQSDTMVLAPDAPETPDPVGADREMAADGETSAESPASEEGDDAGAAPQADAPIVQAQTPSPARLPQVGQDSAETDTETETATAPATDTVEVSEAQADDGDTPDAGPRIGQGASNLATLNPEIKTNRLPRVSDGDQAAQEMSPLSAFAAEPVATDGKPLMSIVLIDDGSTPLGLEALASFPYPLSFAVDAEWAGAAEAMARYRAAGFDVMALANMPEGAQASDVAVALSGVLDVVPEAVGVLEGDGGGLQGSRAVTDQVASALADSGHGLVLYPQGLNTAVSLAQRAGVPARTLFRDFDGAGQSPTVIRRFLDQAAFKAGQEGAVIMVGRLRADTISALLIWGLQDRASRVAFVPVSQVLIQPPS
ncbi:divergent polysaccharide deacetylase family protein [Primorskyibacter sp. S187A]|uniref:divergent polysaccharide deacetylase family protein n=1 Tax=Primorskyibacter sp. S187A TaxID=3415130 RepID=UPI003C7E958E